MNRTTFILAALLLASCARSEEASLIPPDTNQGYNQVGRVGIPEKDDGEPAIGEWRASLQENVQALEFGPMGTEPLFSLLCASNRGLLLQRHGGVPSGNLPAMIVSKGELSERLQASIAGGAIPKLRSELPLQNPIAQAMAGGGDPLIVRLDDAEPLVLPPSPLIGDYLRSCATARALPSNAGSQPAANSSAPAQPSANTSANAAQPKQ